MLSLLVKNTVWLNLLSVLLITFNSCNSQNSNNIKREDLLKGMTLTLSDKAFTKIKTKREEALKRKLLIKSKTDYVNGILECNDKKLKVKARLKGDHVDHFETNRWSFRIIADEGEILNHSKISVQGVHTRAFLNEWIYHKLLKKEGVINLQYEFFPFCVNDTLCGIYAFESHFDNYLLEMANKEKGPILKFDETDFWDYKKHQGNPNRDEILMKSAPILLANKKWGKNKKNYKQFEKAKQLLDDFRTEVKRCEEVFDLEQWAKYLAVNELIGGDHALRWHNLRFYYNPTSKKLEPIGFDSGSWMLKDKKVFYLKEDVESFHKLMLINPKYQKLVNNEISKISSKQYMIDFFKEHHDEIERIEALIKTEKEDYTFWESSFYQSQTRILEELTKDVNK